MNGSAEHTWMSQRLDRVPMSSLQAHKAHDALAQAHVLVDLLSAAASHTSDSVTIMAGRARAVARRAGWFGSTRKRHAARPYGA